MSGAERAGRTNAFFRAVNDRILELSTATEADHVQFVCECDDAECRRVVELTITEYDRVRARAGLFFVAAGHGVSPAQRVTERRPGFSVVQVTGAAAAIGQATRLARTQEAA